MTDLSRSSTRRNVVGLLAAGAVGVLAWRTLSASGADAVAQTPAPFKLSDAAWRARLSPGAYAVLRQAATERPYSSSLNGEHRRGAFVCAGCALPLYASHTKFDSGTGWPSFYDHLPHAIGERADFDFGGRRTEVHCARCAGHLGHVFEDGPPPTGLRYCMNGIAMTFAPQA